MMFFSLERSRPYGLELAPRAIPPRGPHRSSAAPVVQNRSPPRSGLSGPGSPGWKQSPILRSKSPGKPCEIGCKSCKQIMYLNHVQILILEAKAYNNVLEASVAGASFSYPFFVIAHVSGIPSLCYLAGADQPSRRECQAINDSHEQRKRQATCDGHMRKIE